jgi:hypothetical protein
MTKFKSVNEVNKNKSLDELYPVHFKTLREAELWKLNWEVPTLKEANQQLEIKENRTVMKSKKKRERERKRKVFFVIGFSKFWPKPIPMIIDEILKNFPSLKWLRYSISYKKFPCISQLIQGDLMRKVNENITTEEEERKVCNCRRRKGELTTCRYDGICCESNVIYEIECKTTGKKYVGNTSQKVKKRMEQHWNTVRKLKNIGEKSTSFASHFASLIPNSDKILSAPKCRELAPTSIRILWQGDPILCNKFFRTNKCLLCTKEKFEILKRFMKDRNNQINSCNEIYGGCRHIPKFHRLREQIPGTDESADRRKRTN